MNSSLYLVVGLGKTGYSIARYLQRRKKSFVIFDTRQKVDHLQSFQTEFPDVKIFLGHLPDAIYRQLHAVITSPGVALNEPVLQRASALGLPIWGDIECFAREVEAPVIAITGTNGKSTVTTLVGEMAAAAGLSVAVAGNIGSPVLDRLDDGYHYDMWVLELSSFQLDLTYSLKPMVATILNVSPDHLDRHGHLSAYVHAKQRIYQQARCFLYNRDDLNTVPAVISQDSRKVPALSYGLNAPEQGHWGIIEQNGDFYLAQSNEKLLSVEQLRIKGKHNWQNALAACALATIADIDVQHQLTVLESFKGLPHRCQWVRNLDGVDWINDSKGTNVGATSSAIAGIGGAMQGKIILIAGGLGKGADFTELCNPVAEFVRCVVLIGEDADKIAVALTAVAPVLRAASLEAAVKLARLQAQPGDVVLLSPACASFDMFRDFNHRGDSFTTWVNQL